MGMQNTLNSCENSYYSIGATNTMLIDKLIGNAYEMVKHVAMNMDVVKHVSTNLEAVYTVSQRLGQPTFVVDCTGDAVTLDVSVASTNELTLTKNVTASSVIGIDTCAPFIRVRVIQDSVGGHTFTWPAAFTYHGAISLTPGAISQQMFALNSDGTFDYVTPMVFPKG